MRSQSLAEAEVSAVTSIGEGVKLCWSFSGTATAASPLILLCPKGPRSSLTAFKLAHTPSQTGAHSAHTLTQRLHANP